MLGFLHGTSLFIDTHAILGNHAQKQNEWLLLWPHFFTISIVSHAMSAIHFSTDVQDCHSMSKLYLVHLRPLGLHGMYLVVLSIQVPVVPNCHGTTRYIPGIPHYLTPPCQSQVPTYHGTTWDNLGHPSRESPITLHHPASTNSQLTMGQPGTSRPGTPPSPPCQSQVRVVPNCHGITRDIPGISHYLTPPCQSQV